MLVNLSEFKNQNVIAKVYNLTTSPLKGVEVYLSCESSDVYNKLLDSTPTLTLDTEEFIISRDNFGESSLNPIKFERPISRSKIKIHNISDKIIGLIVGSDNSPFGNTWASGLNERTLDDHVDLNLDFTNIEDPTLLKHIFDNTRLVINAIYYRSDFNSSMSITDINENNSTFGFGAGGFGSGPYGGT
jgi:hypothetical protein